jgi:catechol 2,3-dioxygenase-like lactoylglutathione lyase family enzyme
MGFHHVAIATRDLPATHRFYTEAMGFELVRVETSPTEQPPGWAKHLFYEIGDAGDGGGMFAVWELHDDRVDAFDPAISTGLGLPIWVNHVAFDAPDLTTLDRAKDRWLDHGFDVMEIDHEWCRSVYTTDPNGILVEWCTTTRAFTAADRADAARDVTDPAPTLQAPPEPIFHRHDRPAPAAADRVPTPS